MPQHDEKHILIKGCSIVWDGITRPDAGPDGKPKYSLKVVCQPNSPDIGLFSALAQKALQESKWAGVLPQGARMPVGTASQTEFNGMFPGFAVLNCNSQRLPDVYDEAGQLLEPMQYGQLLYGGQSVDVLVHCYEYDKAGNKGVATGLDGFSINVSANAPRQQFGSAGINTAAAFGGGGAPAQQQAPMQQQAPAQQQAPPPPQQAAQQQAPPPPPAGPTMTAAANGVTHESYIAQGWTDAQLIAGGLMLAPTAGGAAPQQAHNFMPG